MSKTEMIKDRLKNVMLSDRVASVESLLRVLKSDVISLLSNYMYIENEDVQLTLDAEANGEFKVNIQAKTNRLIDAGKMID